MATTTRILIVEDEAINQLVILRMLERLGFTADHVSDGREALDLLREQPYDVVLMDMRMPVMDGLEATRSIRRSPLAQPYIVALTANALPGDREACLAAGMDDYVSKPIRLPDLSNLLNRFNTWRTSQV
ncbi:MAG: response regulator [Bacteroidota bacterium]